MRKKEREEEMKKRLEKLIVRTLILAIALSLSVPLEAGEKYPTGPITVMVPWAAGGVANVILHTLSPIVEKEIGVPVVVVEKPGSGGAVGWRWVQAGKPEG